MEKYSCFLFALLVLLSHSITLCSFATIFDSATDKHALLSFKNSLISDPQAILSTNWSDDTPVCNWIGVSCGLKHPQVTALNLSGYDLAGTLSPHLGNLTFLRYLDISFNNFTGFLPFQLSNLHRLRVVNASVNSFTGDMPTWLGSLPQLRLLIMSNNSLSGRIPPSLFNNSKLQIVNLRYNHLRGNIPEEIGNASSLQMLYLDFNELSGSIPSGMFNASSMREISIVYNSLTGFLPSDMCNNIPNLETLSLSLNQLSGGIPPNIWKCNHLEKLSLSFNHFSGNIPTQIGSLSMLTELYLGHNNFSGGVPAEIGNLSRLEMLDIANASLTGNIPSSIFNISSLTVLILSNNSLSGSIPREIGNMSMIRVVYLDNNYLTVNFGRVKGASASPKKDAAQGSKRPRSAAQASPSPGPVPELGLTVAEAIPPRKLKKKLMAIESSGGAEAAAGSVTLQESLPLAEGAGRIAEWLEQVAARDEEEKGRYAEQLAAARAKLKKATDEARVARAELATQKARTSEAEEEANKARDELKKLRAEFRAASNGQGDVLRTFVRKLLLSQHFSELANDMAELINGNTALIALEEAAKVVPDLDPSKFGYKRLEGAALLSRYAEVIRDHLGRIPILNELASAGELLTAEQIALCPIDRDDTLEAVFDALPSGEGDEEMGEAGVGAEEEQVEEGASSSKAVENPTAAVADGAGEGTSAGKPPTPEKEVGDP